MKQLEELAALLRRRNEIDEKIAAHLHRPALNGHIGEFVASEVFGIRLADSATQRGFDGHFEAGPLAGKSVDVKYYGKQEGILDLPAHGDYPDFYLVLAGPLSAPGSSRGGTRPFVIDAAFLFESATLIPALRERGIRLGTATSVAKAFWRDALVYPKARSPHLTLSTEQMVALDAFRQLG